MATQQRCCICMESNYEKLTVFSTDVEVLEIKHKLNACLHEFCLLEGSENTVLHVCDECLSNLNIVEPFIQSSKEIQNNWNNLLTQLQCKNIQDLCRLCARKGADFLRLYGTDGRRLDLEDKINNCLHPIAVSKHDTLPLSICGNCLENVLISHELHTKYSEIEKKRKEVSCTTCNKIFPDDKALERHIRCAHNNKNHNNFAICEFCGLEVNILEFKTHNCSILYCKLCDVSFRNKNELGRHYKKIHEKYFCITSRCYEYFNSEKELRNHRIIIHKQRNLKLALCELCGKEISQSTMKTHIYYTHEKHENEYKCDKCPKGYKEKVKLVNHMVRHLNIRKYSCTICKNKYFAKSHLDKHMLMHNNNQYPCEKCGKKYSTETNLNIHIDSIHNITWMYHCNICNEGFKNTINVINHYNTHTQEDKLKFKDIYYKTSDFQCEICLKYFPNRTRFVLHLKQIHNINHKEYKKLDEKEIEDLQKQGKVIRQSNFKCNICSKICKSLKGLNVHSRLHVSRKSFDCKLCGKSFATHLQMSTHSISHTKEIIYRCALCDDITFKNKVKLKEHIIKNHIKAIK